MEHLDFTPSPVTRLNYFSQNLGIEIYCKRDDLFQCACGGSKARMLQYIMPKILQSGATKVVTAGGPCSNFNRSIALLCAQYGLKLDLVSYTEDNSQYESSLNNYIVKACGTRYIYCSKDLVKETIENVMLENKGSGEKAIFIYGGGKSLEGIYSYYDAVNELKNQIEDIDEIYIACGTGTTLTGVCAGVQQYMCNTTVHAVSVARLFDKEKDILYDNMNILNTVLGTNFSFDNMVYHDEFIQGGYGKYSVREREVILKSIMHEGMLVDTTYVGKALFGMIECLRNKEKKPRKVLFWNTGGVIGLLSQIKTLEI